MFGIPEYLIVPTALAIAIVAVVALMALTRFRENRRRKERLGHLDEEE